MKKQLYLLSFSLLLLSACSEENSIPCQSSGTLCPENYSCLGGFCVQDHDRSKGQSCLYDRQCESDLICAKGFYVCAKPCTNYYDANETTCASNEYCQPIVSEDKATDDYTYRGACIEDTDDCTECQTSGNICVSIKSEARACMRSCELQQIHSAKSETNPLTGTNCEPGGILKGYCDYLGTPEQLICLGSPDPMFQGEGGVCDKVENPCAAGYLCHKNICRAACELSSPECTQCCDVGRGDIGVCSEDATCTEL